MTVDLALRASVGLLPVLALLGVLLWMDSYKLVRLRMVIIVILAGSCAAAASYVVNALAYHLLELDYILLSRYIAPVVEELMKGLVIVWLIRTLRIGFLVDAAIFGFAVGAGFAMIENLYYLRMMPDASLGTWIVRGFGTAIMHGGATAIFSLMGLTLADRDAHTKLRAFIPGFLIAVLLHSAYNHFFLSPIVSTLGILVVLPPLLYLVFIHGNESLGRWLGAGFDADARMLDQITSGAFQDTPAGIYLHELKDRFEGPVVSDLLCYLRLHTELALRAKGVLMAREAGFETPIDSATQAKFEEMSYLEGSIGKTGRLALQPMLHTGRKDLWQLYMLAAVPKSQEQAT